MATDPYQDDDDDNAPTLQRPSPASGLAPRQPGLPAKLASGLHAAYTLPSADLEDLASSVFAEEDDTAVDRAPLAPLPGEAVEIADMTTELLEETATRLPDAAPDEEDVDPLDEIENTVTLPADIMARLRRASQATDPPPAPSSEPSSEET